MRWFGVCGARAMLGLVLVSGALTTMASSLRAAELIMFEREGCLHCAKWMAEVAPSYSKSAEGLRVPLRRHDLARGQDAGIKLARPVRFSPTFVLVDQGREIDRITGYIDNATFWGLFAPMLARMQPSSTSPSIPPKQVTGKGTSHE
jgi:hypothetical protein